jgi:uncharacterized protein YbbK (DUF523 family)
MDQRPRVGISRCLLGDEVRYDGGHKYAPSLIETLGAVVEWVPVCPEVEVGMGVPREPIQLVAVAPREGAPYVAAPREGAPCERREGRRLRLVGVETGEDWTARMQAWACNRLAALEALRLSGFVLKARSPSCGVRGVPIQDQESGAGMFAQALVAAMPGLPVEDEETLRDPAVRAQFLERISSRHRERG